VIATVSPEPVPSPVGQPTREAVGHKVRCFSRAACAPGRAWASNLRGALPVDHAIPTVPDTSATLPSKPTVAKGRADLTQPFRGMVVLSRKRAGRLAAIPDNPLWRDVWQPEG
jgi:hypothetical protein